MVVLGVVLPRARAFRFCFSLLRFPCRIFCAFIFNLVGMSFGHNSLMPRIHTAMSSIEHKFVAALLKTMRGRRVSSGVMRGAAGIPAEGRAALTLREVGFDDFEAVSKLKERWGFSEDSQENWYRLWRDNPAVASAKSPLGMGWVLEVENQTVGYLGSVPLLYFYGGRPLLAATTTSMVIEPAYRGCSMGLLAAFYRQKDVDLFLITTAIESVGKLARTFLAQPLPQNDYDTVLFWVCNAHRFAKSVVRKFGVSGRIGAMAGLVGSFALCTEAAVRRRRLGTGSRKFRITELPVSEIGEDFESLWRRKLNERPCLLADRSPASLRWHFNVPRSQRKTTVLCCHSHGRLRGYVVVQNVPETDGLCRCFVADMVVEGDDRDVMECLLGAAHAHAQSSGSDVFEILGFPGNIRQILMQWRPHLRKYPACPFFFKAKDKNLRGILAAADAWYANPYDGDTSLVR